MGQVRLIYRSVYRARRKSSLSNPSPGALGSGQTPPAGSAAGAAIHARCAGVEWPGGNVGRLALSVSW